MFCTTELFLVMTIFILNEHSLIFLQITLQEIVFIPVGCTVIEEIGKVYTIRIYKKGFPHLHTQYPCPKKEYS